MRNFVSLEGTVIETGHIIFDTEVSNELFALPEVPFMSLGRRLTQEIDCAAVNRPQLQL